MMSYKVEITEEEHSATLSGTLSEWSRQDHDVHLISTEGHRIFSHRVLLSLYSSQLQRILNDPVLLFSPQPASISVPASASSISTLLKMLTSGKVETGGRGVGDDVAEAAAILGIKMSNIQMTNRNSSSIEVGGAVNMKKKKSKNSIDFLTPDVELEEFDSVSEGDDKVGGENSLLICTICDKVSKNISNFNSHRLKKHGIRQRGVRKDKGTKKLPLMDYKHDIKEEPNATVNESIDEKEESEDDESKRITCGECGKAFRDQGTLRRHELIHLPEDQKPHKCDFCSKRFCQAVQKRSHMNMHQMEGEREDNVE